MQGIMETAFDLVYLVSVILIGIIILKKAGSNRAFRLFGIMAIILGLGDAFHLIPRSYALLTTGLEANAAALGLGKWITSITMTVFYILLFEFWKIRYNQEHQKNLSRVIYGLAIIRVILCFFPQNDWFNFNASVTWGIYRNIPFAIMGLIILVQFFIQANKTNDKAFKLMWFAITLSFGFYVPVVLWAKTYSWIGMLMIPKTLAYVWVVVMGLKALRSES